MRNGFLAGLSFLVAGITAVSAQEAVSKQETAPPPLIVTDDTPVVRCTGRMWGTVEYLLWWTKTQGTSTPLLTASNNPNLFDANGNSVAGGLGREGTSILVGDGDIRYGGLSGLRFTLGAWLDLDETFGVEARGFFLSRGAYETTFRSDTNGNPIIGNPIIDTAGLFGGGENAIVASFPLLTFPGGFFGGGFFGGNTIISHSRLWGGEASALFNFTRYEGTSVDLLIGFRYADLKEDVTVIGDSSNIVPAANFGGVAFMNNFFDGTVVSIDSFRTRSQFYGGQIGVKTERPVGAATLNLDFRLAMGNTRSVIDVEGTSQLITGGAVVAQAPGGTYALASNSGRFTRDSFSVIPEVELKLTRDLTDRVRGFVGYNFMYWTEVARPGQQIDRNVDIRQVPLVPGFVPGFVGASPAPQLRTSDFWAQGLTFGFQVRY